MKRILLVSLVTLMVISVRGAFAQNIPDTQGSQGKWWEIQSIDTMKYSRDRSRQVLADPGFFRPIIEAQMKQISGAGATHVAIGTPYDAEFLPVLRLWVDAARKHGLKVWFRGNWSGWEGWFNYSRITRQQHVEKTREYLRQNQDLFADGDIFTPCPECENGGPGDPRFTGDVTGFRQFMIDEYEMSQAEFKQMGKSVQSNLASSNGDVVRLVMDPATTQAMGGVVTIDHYVADPAQLSRDVEAIAESSQGKVVLGEIGVPIPNIHGGMTPQQQAAWLESALLPLAKSPELVGINYWVSHDGSTQLWPNLTESSPAAETITQLYTPLLVSGIVTNFRQRPLRGVMVTSLYQQSTSDESGKYVLPVLDEDTVVVFRLAGYETQRVTVPAGTRMLNLVMHRQVPPICRVVAPLKQLCQNLQELFL
jgi:hypothetical protein